MKTKTLAGDVEKNRKKRRRPKRTGAQARGLPGSASASSASPALSLSGLPVERQAALLTGPVLSRPGNTLHRARIMRRMQRTHGNAYVQYMLQHAQPGGTPLQKKPTAVSLQRKGSGGSREKPDFKLPPGPYTGRRMRNDRMDPWQDKQQFFRPAIFKMYTRNQALWAPLQHLIYTFDVRYFGDWEKVKINTPALKQAAWRLIRGLESPEGIRFIKNEIKYIGEQASLHRVVYMHYQRHYPPAYERAQRAWRHSNFRLFHEWAAVHFGFVKWPYAYWAQKK